MRDSRVFLPSTLTIYREPNPFRRQTDRTTLRQPSQPPERSRSQGLNIEVPTYSVENTEGNTNSPDLRRHIEEGLRNFRAAIDQFNSEINSSKDIPVENLASLFKSTIGHYMAYAPYFDKVKATNEMKYQNERNYVNAERNFINNLYEQFAQLKSNKITYGQFRGIAKREYQTVLAVRKEDPNANIGFRQTSIEEQQVATLFGNRNSDRQMTFNHQFEAQEVNFKPSSMPSVPNIGVGDAHDNAHANLIRDRLREATGNELGIKLKHHSSGGTGSFFNPGDNSESKGSEDFNEVQLGRNKTPYFKDLGDDMAQAVREVNEEHEESHFKSNDGNNNEGFDFEFGGTRQGGIGHQYGHKPKVSFTDTQPAEKIVSASSKQRQERAQKELDAMHFPESEDSVEMHEKNTNPDVEPWGFNQEKQPVVADQGFKSDGFGQAQQSPPDQKPTTSFGADMWGTSVPNTETVFADDFFGGRSENKKRSTVSIQSHENHKKVDPFAQSRLSGTEVDVDWNVNTQPANNEGFDFEFGPQQQLQKSSSGAFRDSLNNSKANNHGNFLKEDASSNFLRTGSRKSSIREEGRHLDTHIHSHSKRPASNVHIHHHPHPQEESQPKAPDEDVWYEPKTIPKPVSEAVNDPFVGFNFGDQQVKPEPLTPDYSLQAHAQSHRKVIVTPPLDTNTYPPELESHHKGYDHDLNNSRQKISQLLNSEPELRKTLSQASERGSSRKLANPNDFSGQSMISAPKMVHEVITVTEPHKITQKEIILHKDGGGNWDQTEKVTTTIQPAEHRRFNPAESHNHAHRLSSNVDMEDYHSKQILLLEQQLRDREVAAERQAQLYDDEIVAMNSQLEHQQQEIKKLREREFLRTDLDKGRNTNVELAMKEINALTSLVNEKNAEILHIKRKHDSYAAENEDHMRLLGEELQKLGDKYTKVAKELHEVTATNTKLMLEARVYKSDEVKNHEIERQFLAAKNEIYKLRDDNQRLLYENEELSKHKMEQMGFISACEEQIEKAKAKYDSNIQMMMARYDKERESLVESHRSEENKHLTRIRELENQLSQANTSNIQRASHHPLSSASAAQDGAAMTAKIREEHEAELREMRESNIKFKVDASFLKEDLKKKEETIQELEELTSKLSRELTETQEQNYEKVRDCYAKEKELNEISQRFAELMRKHTAVLKSLETHEHSEAQLRKELNEYHARLMRLSEKNAAQIEDLKTDPLKDTEMMRMKEINTISERKINELIEDNIKLKQQIIEVETEKNISASSYNMDMSHIKRIETDNQNLKEDVFRLKQKIMDLEEQVLESDIAASRLTRMKQEVELYKALLTESDARSTGQSRLGVIAADIDKLVHTPMEQRNSINQHQIKTQADTQYNSQQPGLSMPSQPMNNPSVQAISLPRKEHLPTPSFTPGNSEAFFENNPNYYSHPIGGAYPAPETSTHFSHDPRSSQKAPSQQIQQSAPRQSVQTVNSQPQASSPQAVQNTVSPPRAPTPGSDRGSPRSNPLMTKLNLGRHSNADQPKPFETGQYTQTGQSGIANNPLFAQSIHELLAQKITNPQLINSQTSQNEQPIASEAHKPTAVVTRNFQINQAETTDNKNQALYRSSPEGGTTSKNDHPLNRPMVQAPEPSPEEQLKTMKEVNEYFKQNVETIRQAQQPKLSASQHSDGRGGKSELKNYMTFLESMVATPTERQLFREVAVSLNGLFFENEFLNLYLERISADSPDIPAQLSFDIRIVTAGPVTIESCDIMNHSVASKPKPHIFIENNEILKFTVLFDDLDFVAPPIIKLVLKSPEGEVGELPVLLPVTTFNFYTIQPSNTIECKSLFQRPQMKDLSLRVTSDDRDTFWDALTSSITNCVRDPHESGTCWLKCISPLDDVSLIKLELISDSQDIIVTLKTEMMDQYASSLFSFLTFLFAN